MGEKVPVTIRRSVINYSVFRSHSDEYYGCKVRWIQHFGMNKRDIRTSFKDYVWNIDNDIHDTYLLGYNIGEGLFKTVLELRERAETELGLTLKLPSPRGWNLFMDYNDDQIRAGILDYLCPGDLTYVKIGKI